MRRRKSWTVERLEDRDLPSTGLVGVGTDAGTATTAFLYNPDGTLRFQVQPYGSSFTGGVRVAVGDVNGDGTADLITVPGPGGGPVVKAYSGVDGTELGSFFAFEPTFTGGEYVAAADLDGDGKVELIVSPDRNGGPRVRVLRGLDGAGVVADFFAFETTFTGGVRVAVGDVNGDGAQDLVVAAGFGGGPRVAVFDGAGLSASAGTPPRLLPDFFAFENNLRNGVYVAAGDLTGDGKADLVFGAGPGGGPRVMAWDGGALVATAGTNQVTLVNFFPWPKNQRGGVPVAVDDLDGDGVVDLLVGSGPDGTGQVVGFHVPSLDKVATFAGAPPASKAGAFPSGGLHRGLPVLPPPPVSPPPPPPLPASPPPGGNTPPQISSIPDQVVLKGTTAVTYSFTVSDSESPASVLTVSATSSNQTLIPDGGIVLGGPDSNRTVTLTMAAGQTGTATVTLTVTDPGGLTAADTFAVTVYDGTRPGASSPTGRNPRLVWTPQQQAVWERMVAENHPWWQLIKSNADLTGTPNQRYDDFGQWATLVYQITGDTTYAAKAWNTLSPQLGTLPASGRNGIREYFEELVILYDWLYPALTPTQRTTYVNSLYLWGDAALSDWVDVPPPSSTVGWGTRTTDSDETVGQYMGLALLDLATAPDTPPGGAFLSRVWYDGGVTLKPVGGLDSTGANHASMRNAISAFAQSAEGGQWIESSDYNLGTLKLILMGVQGVRTATGTDHYPELTRFLKQAALAQIYELAPNLEASYQWGDNEHPRDPQLTLRVTLLGMLAGFTQDDPQVGPYVNRLISDLVAKYGATGWGSAEPTARLFYFYNPYAPQADWRTLPPSHFNPGTGLLHFHDGWGPNNSFFGAHMTGRTYVDHEPGFYGDFQLYRKGEWAITHPIGYGGPASLGESHNSMLIAGLSGAATRVVDAQATAVDGSWTYLVGTTGGQYYDQPYWDPPPTFLYEWTRSIFYLPSPDKTSDTIITFDRVDADDPRSLPNFGRYDPNDQAKIEAAPALKQWIIHTPVAPTLTPNAITWTTAGGQVVRVSTLEPASENRTVYDELALWGSGGEILDSEKHYQVRITPTVTQRWDTFLNVTQVSDPGTALNNVGVQSTGGEAHGVLVQRGGLADALVMFGAQEAGRIMSTGYTVNWTAGSTSTQLYLMDLDPTKSWSVRVNGGTVVPLTVTPEGIGQLTVAGTGAQSLQLIAG